MAWYAEYKRCLIHRKRPYYCWIEWYRRYLFQQWYDSLTPEQRVTYEAEKLKKKQHCQELLRFLYKPMLQMDILSHEEHLWN